MKNKIVRKITGAAIIVVAACLLGWIGASAEAQDAGAAATETLYGDDSNDSIEYYCKVTDTMDDVIHASVRAATNLFNAGGNQQGCRKFIDFNVPHLENIQLQGGLTLGGQNNSGGTFVFGPKKTPTGSEKDFARFSLSEGVYTYFTQPATGDINVYADLANANCAIRVRTSDSVIQNIYIQGNRGQFDSAGRVIHGICIEANNVRLKNVVINNMPGAGIIVASGVTGTTFEGEYGKVTNSHYGVIFRGRYNDPLIPVQTEVTGGGAVACGQDQANTSEEVCATECGGEWVAGECDLTNAGQQQASTKKTTFGFYKNFKEVEDNVIGRNIQMNLDAYIVYKYLTMKKEQGSNTIMIQGKVFECDPTFDVTGCNAAAIEGAEVKGIYIYAEPIGALQPFQKNTDVITFVRAATENELMRGAIKGDFKIKFDPTGYEDRRIFLVPVMMNGVLASSSESFILSRAKKGEKYGRGAGDGDGDEDVLEVDGLGFIYAGSEAECQMEQGWAGVMAEFGTDSDGDGIWDYVEMSIDENGKVIEPDCSCTGKLSCWYQADQNNDGILDSMEFSCSKTIEDGNGQKVVDETTITKLTQTNWEGGCAGLGEGYEPLDTDQDGIPDIKDRDNDNDSLDDYVENRKNFYNPLKKAYYYMRGSNEKFQPFGSAYVCYNSTEESSDDSRYNPTIGISWGIYVVNYTAKVITPWQSGQRIEAVPGERTLAFLECRNAMLEPNLDLNYSREDEADNDRSNFMKKDSDGDTLVDNVDTCPWDPNEACKVRKCQKNDILYSINDDAGKYLQMHDDRPIGLKKEEGVPILFKEITSVGAADRLLDVCSDFDGDEIPDCIEVYMARGYDIGTCPEGSVATNINTLDPLNPDTDGDGIDDRHDICPFQKNDNIRTLDREGYVDGQVYTEADLPAGCDPHQLYKGGKEYLAFYMDRDGDGRRDIEEYNDANVDIFGAEHIAILNRGEAIIRERDLNSPTDPLRKFTDMDEADDYVEIEILHTMPAFEDTDSDGLTDSEEVMRDGNVRTSGFATGRQYGCGFDEVDTDPKNADSDGDGLTDFQEITILGTSPNNMDSDLDGLCDGTETKEGCRGHELLRVPTESVIDTPLDAWLDWSESNPCSNDTDGDDKYDAEEEYGCRNHNEEASVCNTGFGFDDEEIRKYAGKFDNDSDQDGMPDNLELQQMVGTSDFDEDGLVDGCINGMGELCNAQRADWANVTPGNYSQYYQNCTLDFTDCDTNPDDPDSDDDGLNDRLERIYGDRAGNLTPTNPWISDTDGDCIPDGTEDKNMNGKWDSDETRAASEYTTGVINGREAEEMFAAIDTDGDGLPDGTHQALPGWEDGNCNGIVDVNPETGIPIETNPRRLDSDGNGSSDYDEMTHGGHGFDIANIPSAVQGGRRGCSMMPGADIDWSVIAIFAALVGAIAAIRRRAGALAK